MSTIVYHGSKGTLAQILRRDLPAVAAGRQEGSSWARGLQLRLGVVLLAKVQQAFIAKSRGGVGSDGIQWKSLKPETIAQRRTTRDERKQLGIGGKRVRGLLTPSQDRQWKAIFRSTQAQLMARFGMGPKAAAAKAAQKAWAILKAQGAQTKLAVLGGRQVDIGRDTGRLFRSFSPGVEDRPSGAKEQVFETLSGQVIVGTNVPYASRFHALRPFWPVDGSIPPVWWPDLLGAALRGLAVIAKQLVR